MGGVSAAVSKTAAAPIERVKLLIQNQVRRRGAALPPAHILAARTHARTHTLTHCPRPAPCPCPAPRNRRAAKRTTRMRAAAPRTR